jgi:hypothetical protein
MPQTLQMRLRYRIFGVHGCAAARLRRSATAVAVGNGSNVARLQRTWYFHKFYLLIWYFVFFLFFSS